MQYRSCHLRGPHCPLYRRNRGPIDFPWFLYSCRSGIRAGRFHQASCDGRSSMRKLCPFPTLSMALAGTWLVLAGISPLHLAVALLAALAIPLSIAPLLDMLPGVRSLPAAMRLVARVLWDILIANIIVARLVLGPVSRL